MNTKTRYFILELFNVPKDTTKAHLSISNENINHWSLDSIKEKKGEYVAYIRLLTNNAISTNMLDGEVIVSASNHNVMGTDIFIQTKDSFEKRLITLVEKTDTNNIENQQEIKWLADLLDYNMESLDSLILLAHECPLYTDSMASTYWKYIESLEDKGDAELIHDVNSDITVMENTTMPTAKLYIAYHGKDSEAVSAYLNAEANIDDHYPVPVS